MSLCLFIIQVVELVEGKCSDREVKKYKSYIDDVEKITKLLLKLSRRLARAENELRNAPMDATDDDKVMVYEYTKKIYIICNIYNQIYYDDML